MTWLDRRQQCIWISPKKTRFVINYGVMKETVNHLATVYNTPHKDGGYAVDLGVGESHFPMTAYIFGDDHDIEGRKLFEALREKGNSQFQHPFLTKGALKTVQVLSQEIVNEVFKAANGSVIKFELVESLPATFVETKADAKNKLKRKFNDLFRLFTTNYTFVAKQTRPSGPDSEIEGRVKEYVDIANEYIRPKGNFLDEILSEFEAITDSITSSFRGTVGEPFLKVAQFISLVRTPANMIHEVTQRIQGYNQFAEKLREIGSVKDITASYRDRLRETAIILSSIELAVGETLLGSNFKTRREALVSANALLKLHEDNRVFLEGERSKFQGDTLDMLIYDSAEEAKELEHVIQLTAANVSRIAFDLNQERVITLSRERTILDLSFELFGSIDDKYLEQLITVNDLSGDERRLLSEGRRVVYYV